MAKYTNSETVDGPFPVENPLDPLVEFYRKNGYLLEEWEETPSPEREEPGSTKGTEDGEAADGTSVPADEASENDETAREDDGIDESASDESDAETDGSPSEFEEVAASIESGRLHLSRGRHDTGWWSSDMTKLHAEVTAVYRSDSLEIDYEVDVSGQRLTEDDRAFWDRELDAAAEYVMHPHRTPRDLRHEEAKRAEELRRRMLTYGIWGAIIAFFLVIAVNFIFFV